MYNTLLTVYTDSLLFNDSIKSIHLTTSIHCYHYWYNYWYIRLLIFLFILIKYLRGLLDKVS